MPVLEKLFAAAAQVYSQGKFEDDIVVVEVSFPGEFQKKTRIEFGELVLEKQA